MNIGVLAGVADLCLIHNGELIFIEMKTEKGALRPAQEEFRDRVQSHVFKWFLCRSLEEFKKIVDTLNL